MTPRMKWTLIAIVALLGSAGALELGHPAVAAGLLGIATTIGGKEYAVGSTHSRPPVQGDGPDPRDLPGWRPKP